MLSERSSVTVEQVKAELAESERDYTARRAKLLEDFKQERAKTRRAMLTEFAAKGRVLRASKLAEISGPYKRQRKRLQAILAVLDGEVVEPDESLNQETPETTPEPEAPTRARKGEKR